MKIRKPPTTLSGIMHKLLVYDFDTGALIGYGYMISYPSGFTSKPELFDIAGERLGGGMYNLQPTSECWDVVVPRNIQ